MSQLRLVLVTQQFWPLPGRAATNMGNLAAELAARRIEVTVLTPRWHKRWPSKIHCREVPVIRLPNPPGRGCRTSRYQRSLARWLRRNIDCYDLIYVSMLKYDAYAALGAVGPEVPVVLRAEASGRNGDCLWQLDAAGGRRVKRRCMKADAIVGPSRAMERELIAAGYPRRKIHYIPNGVPILPRGDARRRAAARAVLATANTSLRVPDGIPVAVYAGRLHESKGLVKLVEAWRGIVNRWPQARLWLVGEGPAREALVRKIAQADLSDRVVLAGVFDHVDEVLAAADLYVSPSMEEETSLATLEAMAAGLPIVATDVAGIRELIPDEQHGLLVPPDNVEALVTAIRRVLYQPESAARLGANARDRARGLFSLTGMVDSHVDLFNSLIGTDRESLPGSRRRVGVVDEA